MECLLVFIIVLSVALWVFASATGRISSRSRQKKLLNQIAKQFGGVYRSGGLFGQSSAAIRYGDTWSTVTAPTSHGPFPGPCLQIQIEWQYVKVRCEIFSRREADRRHQYVRIWPPVELANEFDANYEVLGHDSSEVSDLLTSGVRWHIERLAAVGPNRQLRILIREGNIIVQKPWRKPRADLAAQFVQGSLELYDQCMLAKATGIQFLHSDEAQPLGQVICKICGEEIQEQMVICRRCKTPHHLDCWQYTGTCSVFGCRETQYILPETGKMA